MGSPQATQVAPVRRSRRPLFLKSAIRRMVEQIVDAFHPEKVILFGSHARGMATPESDVDVLVVMPTKDPVAQACRIRLAVEHPFPLDLLVGARAPGREIESGRPILAGDSFRRQGAA